MRCLAPPVTRRSADPAPGDWTPSLQRTTGPAPTVSTSRTGAPLPAPLRRGVERLSGYDMGDVRVHRASPKPERLGALAYTHGLNIFMGPGQERHLPHEAWHAAQQMQGRVSSRFQAAGLGVNDDAVLEAEADAMGRRALGLGWSPTPPRMPYPGPPIPWIAPVQRVIPGLEWFTDPANVPDEWAELYAAYLEPGSRVATDLAQRKQHIATCIERYRSPTSKKMTQTLGIRLMAAINLEAMRRAYNRRPHGSVHPAAAKPAFDAALYERWLAKRISGKSITAIRQAEVIARLSSAGLPDNFFVFMQSYFQHTAGYQPTNKQGRDIVGPVGGGYFRSTENSAKDTFRELVRAYAARSGLDMSGRTSLMFNASLLAALDRYGAVSKTVTNPVGQWRPDLGVRGLGNTFDVRMYASNQSIHPGPLGLGNNVFKLYRMRDALLGQRPAESLDPVGPERDRLRTLTNLPRPDTNYHDDLIKDRGDVVRTIAAWIQSDPHMRDIGVTTVQSHEHPSIIIWHPDHPDDKTEKAGARRSSLASPRPAWISGSRPASGTGAASGSCGLPPPPWGARCGSGRGSRRPACSRPCWN